MISTSDLAAMRSVQEQTMTNTALVKRRSLASDSMGGVTETWSTVATVACRVSSITGKDQAMLGGRIVEGATLRVTVPALTTVQMYDRLYVGSRQFEVLALSEHTVETARVIVCEERQ